MVGHIEELCIGVEADNEVLALSSQPLAISQKSAQGARSFRIRSLFQINGERSEHIELAAIPPKSDEAAQLDPPTS